MATKKKAATKKTPPRRRRTNGFTTEVVALSKLKPHPRNYNRHPDVQLDHIAASIRENGFYRNVVVASDNTILAGHGAAEAANRAELTEIPVHRIKIDPDSPQALKILAGDNEVMRLAEYEHDDLVELLEEIQASELTLLGTGYDDDEVNELIEQMNPPGDDEETAVDLDQAEKLLKKWKVQPGDLFELVGKGSHRLLCGDSTVEEIRKRVLDDPMPKLMSTDPPYGVMLDMEWRDRAGLYDHLSAEHSYMIKDGKFNVSNDDRQEWSEAYKVESLVVVYVWHTSAHASIVQAGLESIGFEMVQQIIWMKSLFAVSRQWYHWQHEPCWLMRRKGAKVSWHGDKSQSTVWQIASPKQIFGPKEEDKQPHPTQKPIKTAIKPILHHTKKGESVYEPFCGSGTTMAAAEETGRRCYAIEIEPKYCAVALERLKTMGCKVTRAK